MKRYLTTLIALVAMATGAWAATSYGFSIDGVMITSDNYESESSGKPWYYDPENNILHLTDGIMVCKPGKDFLSLASYLNSTLTIQVDGNFKTCFDGQAIYYGGYGTCTICGEGTLTLEPQSINISGLISCPRELTIKDLTLNITSYGSSDVVFASTVSDKIILDNCEINIKSGYKAWAATPPTLINCYFLEDVFFYRREAYVDDSHSEFLKELHIKRNLKSLDLSIANLVIGEPLPSTISVTDQSYDIQVESFNWYLIRGDKEYSLSSESTCILGNVYRLDFDLHYNEKNGTFQDDLTVKVNGKQAEVTFKTPKDLRVSFTFPQLANTYYDVWVGGKQVNDYNQKDVLGDGGSVKYSKTLGSHSLTLANANITNTGDTQYDYTGYGRGIYSNLSGLTIRVKGNNTIDSKGEGIYFTGNLSILGSSDNQGKLSVKGSYGIRPGKSSTATTMTIGGVELTAEGTSGAGIGASTSFSSSSSYNCTMTVGAANTVVKAKGTSVSLGNLYDLVFEDGLEIMQPTGAVFSNNRVRDASGNIISNQWVVIGKESSITTGEALPLNDNGEMINDKAGSWFTIDGRKLSGQPTKKGVYIHNGKAVVH